MFNRILVAVDGSAHAERAVAMAAGLAATYGARLSIIQALIHGHVTEEMAHMAGAPVPEAPPMAAGGAWVDYQMSRESKIKIAEALLERARSQAKEAGVDNVDTYWDDGDPAHVVIRAAEYEPTDLVVVGSRGLGQWKGLMLGSVSSKVQQMFDGNVLTVR